MAHRRRKLGEILKRWGRITDKQLDEALKVSEGSRHRIGETLIEMDVCSEADVAKALAAQNNLEYVDLDKPNVIDKSNLDQIPKDLIKKHIVLPLGKKDGRYKVLAHDPNDLELIDNLRFRLNGEVDLAIGARSKIKAYIDEMLSETRESIDRLTQDLSVYESIDRGESLDSSIDRGSSMDLEKSIDRGSSIDVAAGEEKMTGPNAPPIVRLVEQVIHEAVTARTSDIHIEPMENRVRLRYRVDGVCHERDKIPKRVQNSVIARLKIMAGVKVEEKRIPQDGRIKMQVGDDSIDFRVSFCPCYHGESVVLRILRPDSVRIGLENLGMREDTLNTFNDIIRRPNGIFLVTGPTGSGKTTTLYSALNELNRPDKKIITAEDPVEYNFKGINQCQVNAGIGMSFATILRAMLRQAPNIVLVGEIRDKEVGDVAIQAALTGHLVFSTLHTNDAPSAMTRLTDMGIKPFLVASSIQAVLAQRLVRILCPHCKAPDDNPDPKYLHLIDMKPEDREGKTIYKPVGCNKCSGTGYRGRRGIYELMVMNHEIRELAFKRATLAQLRKAAIDSGMRPLVGDGKLKVLDGLTTPDEVARISQVEGVAEAQAEEEEAAA